MKYASKQTYAGQRASIGRAVVVNTEENGLGVGLIDGIGDDECVWICEVADDSGVNDGLVFHETKTEADIEAMPEGHWTWPVRV